MPPKLSDYFLGKLHYNAESINGVMGLKNAADIMYDIAPKDLGIIQPPWLPNLRFSKYALTDVLMCWGSFGLDPDVFKVSNPIFYVHQKQIDLYCSLSGQNPGLVKPIFHSSDYRGQINTDDDRPGWMTNVGKPVLEFLSNINNDSLYARVPDEMTIQLHGPETVNRVDNIENTPNYMSHLSNTQQDDLMRKYILQEKSFTPEAKCSDCATRSCKSGQILKLYAAYQAYQRMYRDMKTVQINGKVKVECSYTYREPIDEKFAPANSNREEALKATNSVIQRLIRIGKLEEFHLQMKDMEEMGTIERLSEEEVKELQHKVHHYNKLNFTTSSTSSSTPLRVLRDSTSKVPNSGGICCRYRHW